jgi:hypothetical protein
MVQSAATHAATNALLAWLLEARVRVATPDPVDGSIQLGFGRQYRTTVAALFAVSTIALGGAIAVFRNEEPAPLVLTVGIFGLMWLAMLYGAHDAFCVTIKASPRGMESKALFRGNRVLPWEAVQRCTYTTFGNWYTFRSEQGWAIRVSIYRNGLVSFSSMVAANIGRSPARMTPAGFYDRVGAGRRLEP